MKQMKELLSRTGLPETLQHLSVWPSQLGGPAGRVALLCCCPALTVLVTAQLNLL